MKRARRGKTYVELCVFAGCCLLVFVSVAQILVFSHRTRSSTGPAGMVSSLASATSADGKTSTSNVNKNNNNNANNNNKNSNNNANNNNNNNANTNKELPRRMHLVSGMQARIRARTKVQQEVRELERSLAKLMRENSITPDEANAQFRSELYARRVGGIIQMAQENGVFPHKVNGSRLRHRGKSLRPSSPSAGSMRTDNASGDPESDGGDAYSLFGDSPAGVAGGGNENEVPSYNANVGGGNGGGNKTLVAGTELGQQRASKEKNDVIKKRKSRPAPYRFRDLDESEEYELKAVVSNASAAKMEDFYREENERMQAAKRAQAEGTELFVDEEALRKESGTDLRVCPRVPESLVGSISGVNLSLELDINEVMRGHSDVMEGGEWRPSTCISRHRVAIIVPYRDRWSHLKVLLYYLIPILKRQQIHFRIFVVEQFGNDTFNKGRIMNAAFREAVKLFDFQCVTFHDVDLVPEDDRNMYSCTEQPKHMSIAIDKFSYVLPYQGLVGGVLSFRNSHFQLVNGYSNMYWGWGAEDDDMTTRILHRGLRIYRPPSNIARYKMVKHDQRKISEMTVRMKLLRSAARRSKLEGLNNVMYKVLFTHKEKLFTHFMVDIGKP